MSGSKTVGGGSQSKGTQGVSSSSNTPGQIDGSASWVDSNDHFWIFGGQDQNNNYLGDLWKFDGENWTWISGNNTVSQFGVYGTQGVPSSQNVPGARYGAVSWIDSNNTLWLFGGLGYDASGADGK